MEKTRTKENLIRLYVRGKVDRLEEGSAGGNRNCGAQLTKMRRGVGKRPGELPELWGMLLDGAPEELIGTGNEPSRAEWAIYIALTLYAVHKQGARTEANVTYKQDQRLGQAVGQLAAAQTEKGESVPNEAVLRRFNVMATSADIGELAWHMRAIIQLLKRNEIPLDYAELAVELYNYQFDDKRANVRLEWGREFYREFYLKHNLQAEDAGKDEDNE